MTLLHRVPELEAPQRPSEAHQEDGGGSAGGGIDHTLPKTAALVVA